MHFRSLAILYQKCAGLLPTIFLLKCFSYPVREQKQGDHHMPGIMNNKQHTVCEPSFL